MTSYPVPITIHCNQSDMYLMNFKLKSNWKEETLALNHFEKENWAKTFGAVAFTQSQTSRSFQSKKNRLLVSCNRSYPLKVLFDSPFTLFSVLGRFQN